MFHRFIRSIQFLNINVNNHDCSGISQAVVCQISIYILEAVVPEEEDLVLGDLHDPLEHNVHYILKRTTWVRIDLFTYDLPRGRRSGLISTDLKCANQVSMGTAE
jgi:hypothetical protein